MTPEDIKTTAKALYEAGCANDPIPLEILNTIAGAMITERERCISILRGVETRNEAEAHLIETIVRRILGVANDRS